MTVPHHADIYRSMNKSGLFVKVVVFAAYVLAMLVPGLTMVGEQTQVEHAQMMAMAFQQNPTHAGESRRIQTSQRLIFRTQNF